MSESLTERLGIFEEGIEETPTVILTDEEAEKVAIDTLIVINHQGYCLWKCRNFRGEIIMLVDGPIPENAPEKYPIYWLDEFVLLKNKKVSEKTERLIHAAKKQARAELISVEKVKSSSQ
jgi:hypothetical protein